MKDRNVTRRAILGGTAKAAAAFGALPYLSMRSSSARAAGSTLVNDIHSQLNPTRVNEILIRGQPSSWLTLLRPLHSRDANSAWLENGMQWEASNSAGDRSSRYDVPEQNYITG